MPAFTYHYKRKSFESVWTPTISREGRVHFKVKLREDLWFTIAPLAFPSLDGRTIWHQSNKDGEIIQPHDLVQAIGEGIEGTE